MKDSKNEPNHRGSQSQRSNSNSKGTLNPRTVRSLSRREPIYWHLTTKGTLLSSQTTDVPGSHHPDSPSRAFHQAVSIVFQAFVFPRFRPLGFPHSQLSSSVPTGPTGPFSRNHSLPALPGFPCSQLSGFSPSRQTGVFELFRFSGFPNFIETI